MAEGRIYSDIKLFTKENVLRYRTNIRMEKKSNMVVSGGCVSRWGLQTHRSGESRNEKEVHLATVKMVATLGFGSSDFRVARPGLNPEYTTYEYFDFNNVNSGK
jgi:hypothetical protein